jgi:hypothetical protein
MQPFPPSPAFTKIFASSINLIDKTPAAFQRLLAGFIRKVR